MTDHKMQLFKTPPSRWRRRLVVAACAVTLFSVVISCRTVHRAVVALPDVPGAKYIGSKECEQCHEDIYKTFRTADHANLIAKGTNAISAGCESCHGPCSVHSDSGGETKPPFAFTSGRPLATGFGSRVAVQSARATEAVCYQCHADVRGQFNLPSHHPVPEGRMTCVQCHPPHKGYARTGGSTMIQSQQASCLQCHPAQRGPYVFEHEAVREGCTTCHSAHGSINAKMLTERNANLCLKCHFQQVNGGVVRIGGSDHTARLRQGTCWTAGCHEAVHGSRVNPSLKF